MKKKITIIQKIKNILCKRIKKTNQHLIIMSDHNNQTKNLKNTKPEEAKIKGELHEIVLTIIKSSFGFIKANEIINQLENKFNKKEISQPTLRKIIADLRKDGCGIVGAKNGYKFTKDYIELKNYYDVRMCELSYEKKVLNGFVNQR